MESPGPEEEARRLVEAHAGAAAARYSQAVSWHREGHVEVIHALDVPFSR